jgi:hypothetical protein
VGLHVTIYLHVRIKLISYFDPEDVGASIAGNMAIQYIFTHLKNSGAEIT